MDHDIHLRITERITPTRLVWFWDKRCGRVVLDGPYQIVGVVYADNVPHIELRNVRGKRCFRPIAAFASAVFPGVA